jgi:hypothetical protein
MSSSEPYTGVMKCVATMACLDIALCQRTRARWMALHTLANMVICAYSVHDTLAALDSPMTSCLGRQSSDVPARMIVALHLYHLLAFKCTWDDWIHHLVFVGIIGGLGLCMNGGPILGLVAFFMCGLPGGLDYAMLVLVKHGVVDPEFEKAWNSRINVWIRSPGLVLASYIIYQAIHHGPPSTCSTHPFEGAVLAVLIFANGQYYMQRVTGNAYRKVHTFSS